MNKIIISIIVPCYNQGSFLLETLDSVLAQKYQQWECIIVNDGSTDNSETVAKQYALKDSRFHAISQNNAGPSAARNNGAKSAKGKYLMFLDGDNKIAPDYLQKGLKYMESHDDCALFYSKIEYFGDKSGAWNIHYSTYKDQLTGNSIDCCCILRKSDFLRIGGFDEQMRGFEDWEFFIRLLYHNDVVYQTPEVLFYYRIHNTQTGVNAQAKKRTEELRTYIFNKHKEKFIEYFGLPYYVYSEYNRLDNELNSILNSKAYKFGSYLLIPFKRLFNR